MSTHQRRPSKASFYIDIEKSADSANPKPESSESSDATSHNTNNININNNNSVDIEPTSTSIAIDKEIQQLLLNDDDDSPSSSKKSNKWIKLFSFVFSLLFFMAMVNFLLYVVINQQGHSTVLNNIDLDDEVIHSLPPHSRPSSIHSTKYNNNVNNHKQADGMSHTITPQEYQQQYKQYQDQPVLPHHNFFPYKDGETNSASTISTTNSNSGVSAKSQKESNYNLIVHVDDEVYADQTSKTTKAQSDLNEIFAVNPIIIISNNNPFQRKFETILMNINIHPEPKIVDLIKHPNYKSILSYLESTFEDANRDGDDYEDLEDDNVQQLNKGDNIPRLFIGGVPHGNYYNIFDLYEKNQLQSYLREHGKGKITIG